MTSTIQGFSDSDWGRDPDTRRSVFSYLMFLNGSLISWGSRRQQSVALLSMEAEYMALCLATQEAVWLFEIMKNLKFVQHSPIIIHEDNQACIEFSNHNAHHAKSNTFCKDTITPVKSLKRKTSKWHTSLPLKILQTI